MRILRVPATLCLTLLLSFPAAVAAEPSPGAVALLKKAQTAMGGAEKLAAVKDLTQTMTIKLAPPFEKHTITQTMRYIAPSQIRQEQESTLGKTVVYSNGYSGEKITKKGTSPLLLDGITAAQGAMLRQPCLLMLSDRDASRTVKSAGANAVEISASSVQKVKVEFDPKTGLPVTLTYGVLVEGKPGTRTETFSDWRDVSGVRLPFRGVQIDGDKKVLEFTVSAYKLNTGLTWAALSKP